VKRAQFVASAGALASVAATGGTASADELLDTGSGTLHGTLELPRVAGRVSVVLIISGSGPTDRDGNTGLMAGKNDSLKLLAAGLTERGIASLRYDKRGVGASRAAAASESELRFETYIADAAAWVAMLRANRRFARVFIAGHSEGSLIGMLAARLQTIDGFASLEGAGHPAATVLRAQLRNTPPDVRDGADAVISSLEAGKTMEPPAAVASLFRPSVQPYMISWFRYDPAAELSRLRAPIAIVQGTADIQTPPAEGDALAAAAPSARYTVVPGMNHVLKHAPDTSSQAAIVAGYTNPDLPVVPAVINAVATLAG
jgi:pimeloyl-ACP methyl ester carboxylesterase